MEVDYLERSKEEISQQITKVYRISGWLKTSFQRNSFLSTDLNTILYEYIKWGLYK